MTQSQPNQYEDTELEKQVHDITQTMLIALSEWQSGEPVDYATAKKKSREALVRLIEQEATRRCEALLDELEEAMRSLYDDGYPADGHYVVDFITEKRQSLNNKEVQ